MPNEIRITYPVAATLYVTLRRVDDGWAWNTGTGNWEAWADANLLSYSIFLNPLGGNLYAVDFPQSIPAPVGIVIQFYKQVGSTPAAGDLIADQQSVTWSGTEVTLDSDTTSETIRNYIRGKFGWPVVDCELDNTHIDYCTADSLRNFNQVLCHHCPKIAQNMSQGPIRIQLDSDATGVTEVQALFPESQRIYAQMNVFEIMYRMVFPRLPIADWYMLRSFYEMYQRIRGTEPDWRVLVDPATGQRTLFVDGWSGPYDIYYLQIKDLTLANIQKVHPQYFQHFLDLTWGKSDQVLSMIRGKFQGIPAPGGMLTTNASDLLSEGTRKEEKELEWLNNVGRFSAMPIVLG